MNNDLSKTIKVALMLLNSLLIVCVRKHNWLIYILQMIHHFYIENSKSVTCLEYVCFEHFRGAISALEQIIGIQVI